MWCIYLLRNKFLKADESILEGSVGNLWSFVNTSPTSKSTNKDHGEKSVLSHFIQVPHITQQHSWDCGLACVLMVLRALEICECNIEDLRAVCCTTSIWTVDLAYLLQKFSVNFTYFTVTFGANPDFSAESFYKEQLSNDLVRVNMLFHDARDTGIHVECKSVSMEEISEFILSGKYIAIALVDQNKLSHSHLKYVCISDFQCNNLGYTGHYIVICGYDAVKDEFEILDPASTRKTERVASWCLEQAHKTFGTDEDLLLISLDGVGNGASLTITDLL